MNKCQQEFEKYYGDTGGNIDKKSNGDYKDKDAAWSYHIWCIAWDKSRNLLLNKIKELGHE